MAYELAERSITTAVLHHRLSERNQESSIKYSDHLKNLLNGSNNTMLSSKNFGEIHLGGHSADNHLSALMVLDASSYTNSIKQLNQIKRIKGVISIGGIFDIPPLVNKFEGYRDKYIVPAFGNNTNKWKEVSPQLVSKEPLNKMNYNQLASYLLIDSK